jgi:lipopolysaccharide transport system permease protein
VVQHLTELYRHRVLIDVLVQRELKARYRGTALGLLWSFVNPLLLVIIYTVVFSIYLRIDMKNYPVFLFAGMLPWNCFVAGLTEGTSSIISSGGIIKKVYLPSEIFPLVYVLSNIVHLILSLPILVALILYFGVPITWAWAAFPGVVFLQALMTYGIVLVSASMAVNYRDLLHVIPNVITVFFFLTPVLYPPTTVPERFRFLLDYNPLSYLVEAYHQIFLDGRVPDLLTLGRLLLFGLVALAVGIWIFDRGREHFAESI